jgi:hypothetical protein
MRVEVELGKKYRVELDDRVVVGTVVSFVMGRYLIVRDAGGADHRCPLDRIRRFRKNPRALIKG